MASNYNRKSRFSGSRKASPRNSRASGQAGRGVRPAGGAPRQSRARRHAAELRRVLRRLEPIAPIPGGQLPQRHCENQVRPPLSSVRVGSRPRRALFSRAENLPSLPGAHRHRGRARAGARRRRPGRVLLQPVHHRERLGHRRGASHGHRHVRACQRAPPEPRFCASTPLASASACSKDAWVDDVSVNRVFPNTLELAVTERTITAVVDVPTENAESVQP